MSRKLDRRYRLRFVAHRWRGPTDFAGYDSEGRRWQTTPVVTLHEARKWRRVLSWFSQDIWFMQLQVRRSRKWVTLESWWEPEGYPPPPEASCDSPQVSAS